MLDSQSVRSEESLRKERPVIIDFRGRPATPEFSTYFNPSRVEWIAKRVGARGVSEAYLNSSLEMFIDEMDEAGIN